MHGGCAEVLVVILQHKYQLEFPYSPIKLPTVTPPFRYIRVSAIFKHLLITLEPLELETSFLVGDVHHAPLFGYLDRFTAIL